MQRRIEKVNIIAEIHPQHSGDIKTVEQMILQCKMAGADFIKVQLYNSQSLFGHSRKEFAEINPNELQHIRDYAQLLGIDVFASVFDFEQLQICELLGFKQYKIASRTVVDDPDLCKDVIATGKPVFISNGFSKDEFPYDKALYFYCVSSYPAYLENIHMPDFHNHPNYIGYSDHTSGSTACKTAVVRGAKYIEKHFTLSHSLQSKHEMGHLGSMIFEELKELRKFCDEFVMMELNHEEDQSDL